jgi:hypothetical protein
VGGSVFALMETVLVSVPGHIVFDFLETIGMHLGSRGRPDEKRKVTGGATRKFSEERSMLGQQVGEGRKGLVDLPSQMDGAGREVGHWLRGLGR